MGDTSSSLWTKAIFALVIGILLIGLWDLALRLLFEVGGTFSHDLTVFMGIGRGVLNGLTPYRDLFEIKPPGIFLLTAFSAWLSNGPQALLVIGAICIAIIPLLCAWGSTSTVFFGDRSLLRTLLCVAFGTVIALYVADQGGQGYVESFGVFFGVAFTVLLLFVPQTSRPSIPHIALLSLCLLCGIGLKEPFFLSMLAAALLLLHTPSVFMRAFVLPLALAAAVGLAALWYLGYLGPYFALYVPYILGHHLFHPWGTEYEPLWLRSINIVRLWKNLSAYSLFFAPLIFLLWGTGVVSLCRREERSVHLRLIIRLTLASVLIPFSIGLAGDYYGHHFLFAVPAYTALVFAILRELRTLRGKAQYIVFAVLLALLAATSIWHTRRDYATERRIFAEWSTPLDETAAIVDRVMAQCGFQKYLWYVDRSPTLAAYTRHSPYGPLYTEYGRWLFSTPRFMEGFEEAINESPLLVLLTFKEWNAVNTLNEYVQTHFTPVPPPCAVGFHQPPKYTILFRIDEKK